MSEELRAALEAVLERIAPLAAEDAQFRGNLRRLAEALLTLTETPAEQVPVREESAEPAVAVVHLESLGAALTLGERMAPGEAGASERLPGNDAIELPAGWHRRQAIADADLPLIADRCRLKAEGARWAATRQRRLREGADYDTEIEPKDREIIEHAKSLPDCFLWMNHPSGPSPTDLSLLDDVAGCFDAVAAAIALVREVLDDLEGNRNAFEQSLDLLAEAQSSLRAAIDMIDGPRDNDQQKVYGWLRATAAQRQIFIQRYMRIDDVAAPTGWSDLDARILALDGQLQESRQKEKRQQARIQRVRYHVKRIMTEGGTQHDWEVAIQSIEEMIQAGMPPSNREIRDLLLPVIERLPEMDPMPPGFQLAVRELDRFLANRAPAAEVEAACEPTAEVKEAARRLAGKTVVLIGGDRRPHAQAALKTAFGIKDLIWIATREHEPLEGFEPYIARDEVAIVLLAIRWSSHSFGDVKDFCDRYGKLLVRLPAGYNPNQVAVQILQQIGNRLNGSGSAAQAGESGVGANPKSKT
jgi:hypothetical protein